MAINIDTTRHRAELFDWKCGISLAGLGFLTERCLPAGRQQDCVEFASMGPGPSWSPDSKSQVGHMEIQDMLLL